MFDKKLILIFLGVIGILLLIFGNNNEDLAKETVSLNQIKRMVSESMN